MPQFPGFVNPLNSLNSTMVGTAAARDTSLVTTRPPPPLSDPAQPLTEVNPAITMTPADGTPSHVRLRDTYAARLLRPISSLPAPETDEEMSPVEELDSVLRSADPDVAKQRGSRVTHLLPWMSSSDLQQCLQRFRGGPDITDDLSSMMEHATTDELCFHWLRFLAAASQVGISNREALKRLVGRISEKIKTDSEKEVRWYGETEKLIEALGSSPASLSQGNVNRAFQEVRSSLWKIGCPLLLIDRLINESSRNDHYGQIAYWMFDRWSSDWSPIPKVIGLQYMADRIAAAGDVVLGLYILQDPNRSLEELENIRGGRFLRAWFSDHEKGFGSVMKVANAPSEDMLERVIDAYADPDNNFLPPVHGLIRELRVRAAESAYGAQEDLLHRAAGKLLRACILEPIFQVGQRADNDDHLTDILDSLVDGMRRGGDCSPDEWVVLISETMEALQTRHRHEAAHDFLRAMYKLAICPDGTYSNLRLNLVTNLEITMHARKNDRDARPLKKICQSLMAWKI
jgi:hypothetical protein